MKILKIEKNKIFLEDDEVIDINLDIMILYNLKKDLEISNIYHKIIFESMKYKAIYLVSLKDRTSFEIKEKLKLKYEIKNHYLIDDVIKYLKENQMVSDIDYAIRYIESNISKGKNKLSSNLFLKGINSSIINEAFSILEDKMEISQEEYIRDFINRNSTLDRNKLINRLINRGYKYKNILNVLEE